jgi:sarcosine oxidase/L-pipecolate oxidase
MDSVPDSILIIGSGVFGLSAARAFTQRATYSSTTITVVDDARGNFPPEDASSVDTSRIVRPDYADPDYAALGVEAQVEWRKPGDDEVGGQGRYSESGFILTANQGSHARIGKKSGMDYTKMSWENVTKLAEMAGLPKDKIVALESRDALARSLGVEGNPGDWGYLNKLSGWADAGRAMTWMYEKVKATGRVNFIDGLVKELVTEGKRVVGARLSDDTVLNADLVFVAAGAWTGSLIDLRGRVEATGHVLGYMEVTDKEQAILEKQPVVLNLTSGLFAIPPRDNQIKFARHSFGYLNPQRVTGALPLSPAEERRPIVVSVPKCLRDSRDDPFPSEADRSLRSAIRDLVPIKGLDDRPWAKTRICWYSDTRDADWLVDWHPGWEGLFIATGDSGHGFKFLPVLGDKLVNCVEGHGGSLGAKWRWKEIEDDGAGRETDGVFRGLITEDGSRGGDPGMILETELYR